jgi:membrane protein DedA with SNARE-associated domain
VLVAPNGLVCLLAGTTGMSAPTFAAIDVAGTLGRLVLIRLLADVLARPLAVITRYVGRYSWWLVALSVGVGALQLRRRAGAVRHHAGKTPSPLGRCNA